MAPPHQGAAEQIAAAAMPEHAPLRQATVSDVPRLAETLAAAFHRDPVFEWLLPAEHKRPAGLRRFFEIELLAVGLARGTVWTTAELEGGALSSAPGKWRLPLPTLLAHGPAFARAFGARLPRAAVLLQRVERRHVRGPHHYFPAIGVAPERQGKGLGSKLMAPTLARCDEAGLPAYLEASTERNAALYERLGFDVVDELRYGGDQVLRLMLRAPTISKATHA